MSRRRTKPYTARGISRVRCWRCAKPSRFQWQVCSDSNTWRGLCLACDIALNDLVLRFMGDPDCVEKMRRYAERVS